MCKTDLYRRPAGHLLLVTVHFRRLLSLGEHSIFSGVLTRATGCLFSRSLAKRRPQPWLAHRGGWVLSYHPKEPGLHWVFIVHWCTEVLMQPMIPGGGRRPQGWHPSLDPTRMRGRPPPPQAEDTGMVWGTTARWHCLYHTDNTGIRLILYQSLQI